MLKNELKRYGIVVGLLLMLLFYIYSSFGHVEYRLTPKNDFTIIDKVTVVDSGAASNASNKTIVEFEIPPIKNGRSELVFSTIHQSVAIFFDDTMEYRLVPDARNKFGKTAGVTWHVVSVLKDHGHHKVRVEMWTPYESATGIIPTFYFGEKHGILTEVVERDILPILISFVTFVMGVIFVTYVLIAFRGREVNKDLMHLGFFAICISAWQMADLPATKLLLNNSLVVSYIPFVALMLLPIPFAMFIGGLHGGRKHIGWHVIEMLSYANIFLCTVLQLFDIADFRETLWITHLTFVVSILIGGFLIGWEIKKYGLSDKRKVNIICLFICLGCASFDLCRYYFTNGSTKMCVGSLGFLIYIVSLGYTSIRETRIFIDAMMEAKKYEQLAYHDPMTGCLNRLAWADIIRGTDVENNSGVVVMFDLNDLKVINDTKGHEAGDKYITECAYLLKEVLATSGSIFRLGGDEFCILLHATKVKEAEEFLVRVDEAFEKYNKTHPEMPLSIAYGCAKYDMLTDMDLNDTRSRADSEMYHNKFKMKEKRV